jgi:hypothetical protein
VIFRTVVLCPELAGAERYDRAEVARQLAPLAVATPDADPVAAVPADDRARRAALGRWVAQVAVALATAPTALVPPLCLVVPGDAGMLAPELGASQRAAHRTIAGYLLVDAAVPPPDLAVPDWPDAPVVYLASPAAPPAALAHAELRRWRIDRLAALGSEEVAAALVRLRT